MGKATKVEEIKAEELTAESTTEDWEAYVRSEVTGILDALLPVSTTGAVGVVYKNLVMEETEGGPIYDETKAVGVEVVLSFDFGGGIVKPM